MLLDRCELGMPAEEHVYELHAWMQQRAGLEELAAWEVVDAPSRLTGERVQHRVSRNPDGREVTCNAGLKRARMHRTWETSLDDIARRNEVGLYEKDFHAWSLEQAALLGKGDFVSVDLVNLIEEVESLGRAQVNALRSRYSILCLHLLKIIVQPRRETRSWRGSIAEQRNQIARLLTENPSLKSKRDMLFAEGYEDSLDVCAAQTGLAASAIPRVPPFSVEQAEDKAWPPDSL